MVVISAPVAVTTLMAMLRPRCCQRERPGNLMDVNVKKLAATPDDGGWRTRGKSRAERRQVAGWRYTHTVIDDRTRLTSGDILLRMHAGRGRGARCGNFRKLSATSLSLRNALVMCKLLLAWAL